MKSFLVLSILLAGLYSLILAQTNSIDYFGQTTPDNKAVLFARGIISLPSRDEIAIAFSSDSNECYFTCNIGETYRISLQTDKSKLYHYAYAGASA